MRTRWPTGLGRMLGSPGLAGRWLASVGFCGVWQCSLWLCGVGLWCVGLAGCAAPPSAAPRADAQVASDAAVDGVAKPQPLLLTGPPPTLFDCSHPEMPPQRLATSPLGCVLDPGCSQRLVVGHRGAGGEFARIAPENSLASLRAALWLGYDGVEIDVRHTADGQLILMHDGKVDRTTAGKGEVAKMTAAEVTQLALQTTGPDGQPYPGDFACERVPTLAQALALVKGRMFVDLDCKTSRMDLVVPAIVQAGVIDQVFVSVSDVARAVAARQIDARIRVQIRPDTLAELEAALPQFPHRPPEVIEVPTDAIAAFAPRVNELGSALFANAFTKDIGVVAQDAGGEVLDGQPYLSLYEQGARILQSEFPGAVLAALGKAGKR